MLKQLFIKRILFFSLLLVSLFLFSNKNILAKEWNYNSRPQFYLGGSYQYNQANLNASSGNYNNDDYFDDKLEGFNVFAGLKFNELIALELSYFRSDNNDKVNSNALGIGATTNSKIDWESVGLDAVFSKNILGRSDFGLNLIGLVGASWNRVKENLDVRDFAASTTNKDNFYGVNLGLGLEAPLTDYFALRGIAKYVNYDLLTKNPAVEDVIIYDVGIKLTF